MERNDKKVEDYLEFLDARFECIAEKLAYWGIDNVATAEDEDSIPDEEVSGQLVWRPPDFSVCVIRGLRLA